MESVLELDKTLHEVLDLVVTETVSFISCACHYFMLATVLMISASL